MKLIRYRKPSMRTVIGYTKAKRKVKRATGVSQIQGWTKPSRVKQKLKYKAGLYSPIMRIAQNTSKGKLPSFLGLFNKK